MTGSEKSHPAFPMFRDNPDGSRWYHRVFRITTIRILSQAVFFGLFVFLVWVRWWLHDGEGRWVGVKPPKNVVWVNFRSSREDDEPDS